MQLLWAVDSYDESQLNVCSSARTCDEGDSTTKVVHAFLRTKKREEIIQTANELIGFYNGDMHRRD